MKDKLLKRDVKSVVEKLSPYLPYLGILSGGVTVGKHIIKKQGTATTCEKPTDHKRNKKDDNEASTSQT